MHLENWAPLVLCHIMNLLNHILLLSDVVNTVIGREFLLELKLLRAIKCAVQFAASYFYTT